MNDAAINTLPIVDLAILFDVSPAVLTAALPVSATTWEPPADWMRTARRRAREAQAHTSSTDVHTCIDYLRGLK